jgi:enoyl-CoA hydratase
VACAVESSTFRRGVAQPGSVPAWGAGGQRFKSSRPDQNCPQSEADMEKISPGIETGKSAPPVLSRTEGRVALFTLNRPEVFNALNDALMRELCDALARSDADDAIGCMVIAGNAKAFAAGVDIGPMAEWTSMDVLRHQGLSPYWDAIRSLRKPIIAAVAGYALGGGCELAMLCDIVIAAENAQFGQPEIKLGILPGLGGTQRLPRAVSKAKAMDMCLTARMLGADEAERAGLVSRVVPNSELLAQALAAAQTIAGYSLPMLIMIKESINAAFEMPLAQGLRFEAHLFQASFASQDQKEGMQAFMCKRAPVFRHQ